MTPDRKKPGVAFWTTVAVVVALVGYPLSFGPACWVCNWGYFDENAIRVIYGPLAKLCLSAEETALCRATLWYGNLVPPRPFRLWSTADKLRPLPKPID